MRVTEIIRRPTSAQRGGLTQFVEQVADATGAQPLSDHVWLDLRNGAPDGFLAVSVTDPSGIVALAQISAANDSSSLEVVVRPDVSDSEAIRRDVVETAIDEFSARGGERLSWWVDDPTDDDDAFAKSVGLDPARGLYEMRRPLPLDLHASVVTRDFISGVDEDAFLAVNNRAFAEHGEQGGWTLETLRLRMAEPWFDPTGFRLHEIDGRVVAFCWTKLHHDVDPTIGEIYVIAVDPALHGRGLGKQLTLAGLDSIAARGVTTASLYVDTDNLAAVGLYEQLGFTVHRNRRAYAGSF